MWQDVVFSVGAVVFLVSLIPMLIDSSKPPLTTSIPTSLTLLAFGFTYLSLGLMFSAITTGIVATIWITLIFQRLKVQREANTIAADKSRN